MRQGDVATIEDRSVADVYWRHAWELAAPRYAAALRQQPASEHELRAELLFALLGGYGISYELNRSAAVRLEEVGLFQGESVTRAQIERELSRPQFEPLRGNGEFRRYRFPRRKATLLAHADQWLAFTDSLTEEIGSLETERDRRSFLCECPGVGLKSASWLLRNGAYAQRLAILDMHVVRAMQACGRVDEVSLPKDYESAEARYLEWCRDLGSNPAAFDLLVWDFSRSR